MIHQVTWGKEKPSCSRESDSTAAPAGVIIREQKSILLMACPSTISTNMPRAAIWHTRVGKFNFQGGGYKPDTDGCTERYTDGYPLFLQLGGCP